MFFFALHCTRAYACVGEERVAYTRGGRASVQGVHALGLVYLCAEDVRIVFVLEKLTEGVLEFRCC